MAEIVEVPLDAQPEPEADPPAPEEALEPPAPPAPPEPPAPKAKPKPKGRPKGSPNKPKPAPKAPPPPAQDIEELPAYVQAHMPRDPMPRDPIASLLEALVHSERARHEARSARYASWVNRF